MAGALQTKAAADPLDLDAEVRAAEARAITIAREDPATFVQFVLADEETGGPLDPAPFHAEWHDLISANRICSFLSSPELGKTQNVSVGRILWELGRNPNVRIGLFSAKAANAEKILRAIREYIEAAAADPSSRLARVFPNLRPSRNPGQPWTSDQITVERTSTTGSASVRAFAIGAKISGDRLDFVVGDDCIDHENTATQHLRDQAWRWFVLVLRRRMTLRARLVLVNNAWHPDDLHHRLERVRGVCARIFPILQRDGSSAWPKRWPRSRIDSEREGMTAAQAKQVFECRPRTDADRRFKESWFELGRERGRGASLGVVPEGFLCATGVDLGSGRTRRSARTVVVTLAGPPDGSVLLPVAVSAGRWAGAEIVEVVVSHILRFGGGCRVESNHAQKWMAEQVAEVMALRRLKLADVLSGADPDLANAIRANEEGGHDRGADGEVRAFFTGANKHHPALGVEGLAGDFQRGIVVLPSAPDPVTGKLVCPPELEEVVAGFFDYEPPPAHTPDEVMSWWLAKLELRAACRTTAPTVRQPVGAAQVQAAIDAAKPRPPTEEDFEAGAGRIAREVRMTRRKAERARRDQLLETAKRLGVDLDKLRRPGG